MGETLTPIISAEYQTDGAIATTISSNLLDKRSPRIGVIIFGLLIGFAAFLIPDPNAPITDASWPHNWIHVYCNHALLWVDADQAEEGCHPGPESRAFMADLQMLATYPIYGIILNAIPYTYPAIVGFLVVLILPRHFFLTSSWRPMLNRFFMPIIVVACLVALVGSYYLATSIQHPPYCVMYEVGIHRMYHEPCF